MFQPRTDNQIFCDLLSWLPYAEHMATVMCEDATFTFACEGRIEPYIDLTTYGLLKDQGWPQGVYLPERTNKWHWL